LLGVPLGAHRLSGAGLLSLHDALFLAVFAILAALCRLSGRLAKRAAPAAAMPFRGHDSQAGRWPMEAGIRASSAGSGSR